MHTARHCPALLITAPASGQGKTTITAALARLYTRQGWKVRVFKCGPDFLDPHWHALASGAPVYQLDLWMTGEAECRERLWQAAGEADLILIEGVMGLFDGTPSAADLAQRFGLPVLAVVGAGSMAGTFGAIVHGLRSYREGLRWAGVLANRVGSERHADMLRLSLREGDGWCGAVAREAAMSLPERHLGLTVAQELPDALQRLDACADALAATELGRWGAPDWRQRWFSPFEAPAAPAPLPTGLRGKTIAVARDEAFCFLYQANLDSLQALGAELRFFSPLHDAALPVCDALWLPGGYPELHAATLAGNAAMREAVRAHAASGRVVWAECGGMMALFDTLVAGDGAAHAMWGVLPGSVTMQRRLAGLGPQQLSLPSGATLRGHTFHYSTTSTPLVPWCQTQEPVAPGQEARTPRTEAVWQQGSVRASYFHAWFPSSPQGVVELFSPGGEAA